MFAALHCGAVDFLRGVCLILWCLPYILDSHVDFRTRIRHTRMKQQVGLFLKTLNLLTIFNLFLFTINEFIVINRPIRYRHIFRRQVVKGLLIASWGLSVCLCLAMFLVRNSRRNHGVIVTRNTSFLADGDDGDITSGQQLVVTRESGPSSLLPLQYTLIFLIMAICYFCLFTVLAAYGSILHTIRRFRATEAGGLLSGHMFRVTSAASRKTSTLSHPGSLALRKASSAAGPSSSRYGGIGAGSHKNSETSPSIRSSGSAFGRHIRQYLLNRHKYIMVIGMVLLVDILFLVPYSILQILSFLHIGQTISADGTGRHWSLGFRVLLQVLIGIHAVCQPICYFRMNEFRRLLCRERKPGLPSRCSSSQLPAALNGLVETPSSLPPPRSPFSSRAFAKPLPTSARPKPLPTSLHLTPPTPHSPTQPRPFFRTGPVFSQEDSVESVSCL